MVTPNVYRLAERNSSALPAFNIAKESGGCEVVRMARTGHYERAFRDRGPPSRTGAASCILRSVILHDLSLRAGVFN